jgi:toxin ParE1/3/4
MASKVFFDIGWLASAERDLNDIADYVAENDSPAHAAYVIDKPFAATAALATHPGVSAYVKEIESVASDAYRQVFFKPYRVIYRVMGKKVVIYLVADDRRDMATLLTRRLLGSEGRR